MNTIDKTHEYTLVIEPKTKLLDFDLKELWRYRDLLLLFVRRDFVSVYKQTIFGPLWFFIQPILTTIMFMVVFGGIAKMSTDGLPQAVFYLAGIVSWNYFAEALKTTSETFVTNAGIFGKVYFPRVITPLSIVVSKLLTFAVQFFLFLLVYFYYLWFTDATLEPNLMLLLLPVLIVITAGLALGLGLLITALTTKYRDFRFLIGFAVQLAMYATPIIYPLSEIDNEKLRFAVLANPMTSIIETFRYAFTGSGEFSWFNLGYSFVVMIVLLIVGTLSFNKVEKTFMDTV
ncbi:ABC transporter permease [Subsaximicrobium wynnwilliamsii]|uniref:Transport permease protein n=1 Tax=Subsaximicrobium wynnwilliamsii TaxID=291179 RepID=A0A5C6ZIB9_9FLAO|nr:ABC transporter permease [Subsaximicrobium wynnwilliamsii]TXD81355.1 ABC transporter permease [Subsaximicrobium wynnwilliamsii]TXD89051.1 ABC transporter permease [Subsaximicrobium wynnwilliamsii]TXE00729.1 ABC transporter permease [Subsaximicrobium wynnwilliamsii]